MHATAQRVDQLRQRVDIGRLQLRELPIFEDQADDRVLVAQRLQRVGIGRVPRLGPLAHLEAKVFKEDFRQLLRRVQVELLAGDLLHFGLDGGELGAKLILHRFEVRHVDGDALRLHIGEHAGQRELDLMEEVVNPEIAHLGLEPRSEIEDGFGSPGCKLGRLRIGDG